MSSFAKIPFLAALVAVAACGGDDDDDVPDSSTACRFWTAADELDVAPIYTPRWAFEPWISKDISTGPDTYDFVQGFIDRDIPVGAVVIDSPWETQYNTFVPNPDRYPNFEELVADMHALDVKVVLWVTQMVNEHSMDFEPDGDDYEGPSPNYQEGFDCGYYVNEGDGFLWWKGVGGAIDFFNQDAVAWWRRQQDPLLDVGIDGWKLDFGDEYVSRPLVYTVDGPVDHQDYSEAYYREMYAYGVHRRGREFVTMVRPWDESYGFPGRFFARPEHAPVTWVGDNRRDFVGLIDALDHMFISAGAGYAVLGSDVGGYLNFDDVDRDIMVPFDTNVFARWTAVGALTPFMQLHGRANITPWTVPDNVDLTVELYRYWATLHHELVPFLYSLTQEHYAGAGNVMRPIGAADAWAGDYRYQLGEALLVAPILDATGVRDVALPAGARWYDWWDATADAIDGGITLAGYDATDRRRIPLFVREGAIVPANVDSNVTGLGTAGHEGMLTVLTYPGAVETTFRLHDEDDEVTTVEARDGRVGLSRALRPTVLRIRTNTMPVTVSVGGAALTEHATRAAFDAADTGWLADPPLRSVWVKLGASAGAVAVTWN